MKYFTRKAEQASRTPAGRLEWERLWAEYADHYRSIAPRLPAGARQIHELQLHDAVIVKAERISKKAFRLTIRPWGGRDMSLNFEGVRRFWIPESAVNGVWKYGELDMLEDDRFVLQVLLGDDDEIMIEAESVLVTPVQRASK